MLRSADSEHDKIGYVDDGVDRPHACVHDECLHPCRRFLDADVVDLRSRESVAPLRFFDGDRIFRKALRKFSAEFLERNLVYCSKLSGDTVMAPEIRPVRKRFVVYLEDDIIKSHHLGYGLAGLAVYSELGEVNDPSLVLIADHVSEVYLERRADHTV